MPNTYQIASFEKLLDWLKTCPNENYISSLQGNQLHVKFYIPITKQDEKTSWFKSHTVGLTIDSGMIVPPKMEKIMPEDWKDLEGRDLMWFLLDTYKDNKIDGDVVTAFLVDNIEEKEVQEFLEENLNWHTIDTKWQCLDISSI